MKATNNKKMQGAAKGSNNNHSMLEEFFVDELRDILYAERKLAKTLPEMAAAATNEELRAAIEKHQGETETHVERLQEVFSMLGKAPRGKKCEAMEGLLEEGKQVLEDTDDDTFTRDVAIIFAAQKVEHYEIATYGGLVQLATLLGYSDAASLLQQTLEEEKQCDMDLTNLAESHINEMALEEE